MSSLLYFSGQGIVSVASLNAAGVPTGYSELGNCTSLTIKPGRAATRGAIQNPIGPVRWGLPDGDVPSYTIAVEDLRRENLSRFLLSLDTTVAGGTATESILSYSGKISPLAHMGVTAVSAVTNGGSTTYTLGVDYAVDFNAGGIRNLGGAIADGSTISVSYTYSPYHEFGAFTQSAPLVALRFSGLNTLDAKPVSVDIFKTELPPLSQLDFINEELSVYSLEGVMQKDPNRPFPVAGPWFRVRMA